MKVKLENIFDDISETKHEIKCFTEVLNDYKEYCYLNDNIEYLNTKNIKKTISCNFSTSFVLF